MINSSLLVNGEVTTRSKLLLTNSTTAATSMNNFILLCYRDLVT